MLKISTIDGGDQCVLLRLEGRIAGPWVEELRRACEPFLAEPRAIKLDLADVSFADQHGVSTLANLKSRGVTLTNCSPFLSEQLKAGLPG